MLKLPKNIKKKKKGKKSKKKEQELFTEEELEKYRKEHQVAAEAGESSKKNEEWSKFASLTSGVDTVIKKTQGDLDRIKSTSFFQRKAAGVKEVDSSGQDVQKVEKLVEKKPVVEFTVEDFATKQQKEDDGDCDKSDYGLTDTESEEEGDDIFDTSYVEAVEKGEVKLAYVPDSPDEFKDDSVFDTSYVETIIKGQDSKHTKEKKGVDIGVAVEVLTGRIDNVVLTTGKRSKRKIVNNDLLFESSEDIAPDVIKIVTEEKVEKSILDLDADIPIETPIDLSVSLHTQLHPKIQTNDEDENFEETAKVDENNLNHQEEDDDEFAQLAVESRDPKLLTQCIESEIEIKPVLQESWSAFEGKVEGVFAEGIIEDQIDTDLFVDEDDPFDTTFAEKVIPSEKVTSITDQTSLAEEDDDFNPRSDELSKIINNRRKSSVHIHLTDPSGTRESITTDDSTEEKILQKDLLGGSSTDLTQLEDAPLDPFNTETLDFIDPFDTSNIEKIIQPCKIEIKLLEEELIGSQIPRSLSDDDFDPRAEEPQPEIKRKPSRPENLFVNKSVAFDDKTVDCTLEVEIKGKIIKPLTPYYTTDNTIIEDPTELSESDNFFQSSIPKSQSIQDLNHTDTFTYQAKRRHSEYPRNTSSTAINKIDLLSSGQSEIAAKVLTPSEIDSNTATNENIDPFDTSIAACIQPSKVELKLLAKEFSCEETDLNSEQQDWLETTDDLFQVKALSPVPTSKIEEEEEKDPFDTSFANLLPGRTEVKLLESEFLN